MNGKTNHGNYKKVLLFFVIAVLCALFAVSASAETISGECGKQGDNVTWTFDTETETLTIQGEGEMADYATIYDDGSWEIEQSPWRNYEDYAKTLVICDGVTSIGSGTFYSMTSFSKIILPNTVKSIGGVAFNECANLTEIEIPESVEKIGESAFEQCKSLKSIYIPANVKEISNNPFQFCSSLEKITVDQNNQYYLSDDYGVLFNKNQTILIKYPERNVSKKYVMPNTVRVIGDFAFSENYFIENIILSNNLEVIKSGAFSECFKLKDITFPKTLKRIELGAFIYCWSFKNIVLPENIEYLGLQAIVGCPALESVSIKSMNTQIDEMALCGVDFIVDGISIEEFADMATKAIMCIDKEEEQAIWEELGQYQVFFDEINYIGTIRCHAGSTAEAYAKENGIDCELIHFFSDWAYDWDNLVRSHECDICGYTETEPLEKTENGGVEIVEPVDPDTEFIVEEITKNGDKYAVVEKNLSENLESNYSILKTFDITLKSKDGVHVQPDGTVKVKLPLDWDRDSNYKVYRVNDDGTLTDMEAYREGSHMVFDTDHFSIYVIVDESPEQPQEENDSPFGFIAEVIRMFKELLYKIITFFQSIGDMT